MRRIWNNIYCECCGRAVYDTFYCGTTEGVHLWLCGRCEQATKRWEGYRLRDLWDLTERQLRRRGYKLAEAQRIRNQGAEWVARWTVREEDNDGAA